MSAKIPGLPTPALDYSCGILVEYLPIILTDFVCFRHSWSPSCHVR